MTHATRWWHTLGARLAVALVVALLAFDWVGRTLDPYILEFSGLGPQHVETIWTFGSDWVLDSLLVQAEEQSPGRWVPADQDVRIFAREQAVVGELFAWLSTDGLLLASSDRFDGIDLGDPWPFPLDVSSPVVSLATPGHEPVEFPSTPLRIYRDGQWLGTLVRILAQPDLHGFEHGLSDGDRLSETGDCEFFTPPEYLVMSQHEHDVAMAEAERLYAALDLAVPVIMAVLVGTTLALVVTRRLSRLARQSAEGTGEHGVPGPFHDKGRDEIAALGRAMNAMRGRVLEMVEHLAGRDRRRREWVALVSHDLRTPLTALLACLDRAEAVLDADDLGARRAELSELVAVARLDADRVHALADDLLEIARLDARESLVLEPVPPGELLREAVRELGPMADAAGKALRAEVPANLPVLDADGRRLLRALENLLRNALEHASSRVSAHVIRDERGVRFEVRDDGPGLPEIDGEVQLRKLADRRAGRPDSAGLGLVVTRRVAEAHGGDIGAHNPDGGGAVVWFRLPASRVQGEVAG